MDPIDDLDWNIDSILDADATRDASRGEYDAHGRRRAIGPIHAASIRRPSNKTIHRQLLRTSAAIDQIGQLPRPGEEIALLIDGTFHGMDLLTAAMDLGAAPARVRIGTMSINRTHIDALVALVSTGRATTLSLVASEVFAEKDPSTWAYLRQRFAELRLPHTANRNHTKLTLLECQDGRRFTIHGSMNMRRCNAYEQAHVSADPELHDWYARFLDQALTIR
jgi:hypothetical protein